MRYSTTKVGPMDMEESQMQELVKNPATPATNSLDEDMSGVNVAMSPSDTESSSLARRNSPAAFDKISVLNPDARPCVLAESLSEIKQRLVELDGVEDVLVTQRNKLIAKRKRQDERTQNRWHEEDARINRQREEEDCHRLRIRMAKEDRIRKRREIEDAEYRKQEKAHDDEEYQLRRRLKTLKRGRPVDGGLDGEAFHTSTGSESMSPPAKKHQINRPPVQIMNSPPDPGVRQPLQEDQLPKSPQYSFYPGWNPPPGNGLYACRSGEPHPPHSQPSLPRHHPVPSNSLSNGGSHQFDVPAPSSRHGHSAKDTPVPDAELPRHRAQPALTTSRMLHYDDDPSLVASNWTTSTSPPSGFPSINQRPSHSMRTPTQGASKKKRSSQPSSDTKALAIEPAVHRSSAHSPRNSPAISPPIRSGKRKASSTHPYSQSVAFANRHQHCQRIDQLDRGIWTYFGPGGSKEAPTVAVTKEMYLRCDHDGCMRLDWKTIHGLQCHIVKTHGVRKGTIGSLELALETYGIDVQDVEDYEKKHGLGSAGAMVEKVPRGRPRNQLSDEMPSPSSSGPSAGPKRKSANPPAAKPPSLARAKVPAPLVLFPNLTSRSHNGGYVQDDIVYSEDESDGDESTAVVKHPMQRNVLGPAPQGAPQPGLPTPPDIKADGHATPHQSITHPASGHEEDCPAPDGGKLPAPRPTPSTETLAMADGNSTLADGLLPSSSKIPPYSVTQTPPIGTETQTPVSAAERDNAHLDAADPNYKANPAGSGSYSQNPPQTKTETQSESQDTNMIPNPKTTSTPPPRGGAERRIPVSERWDWAPFEDEDAASGARKKIEEAATLTRAQQELQGLDGPIAEFGAEEEGSGGVGGDNNAGVRQD